MSKDIENTNIGDKVLVDRAGNEILAKIVNKGFYNRRNTNYPIDMTKNVIEVIKDDKETKSFFEKISDTEKILNNGKNES